MASRSPWYPALLAIAQISGSTLIIGFTPGNSFVRLAALPGFTLLLVHFVSICSSSSPGTFIASSTSGLFAHFFFQYLEAAMISKWDFNANSPLATHAWEKIDRNQPQRRHENSVWARLCFGFYVMCSCRYCGTPWETKNVPPFFADDRSKIPTPREFLKQSLRTLVVYFLIVDAMTSSADPGAGAKWCDQSKIAFFSRIQDVSIGEVAFRILTTVSFIAVSYLIVTVCFTVPSIISVRLGVSEVGWWRPIFSSLSEAYTLRSFWGKFWHQQFRTRFTNIASALTLNILGFRKDSLVTRYVKIFFVFFLSGFHHLVVDYGIGLDWTTSGAMQFYATQVIGIILEDAVLAHLSSARRGSKGTRASANGGEKILGYVWVLLWLSWSYPCTIYPILGENIRRGDKGLPISIFRPATEFLQNYS